VAPPLSSARSPRIEAFYLARSFHSLAATANPTIVSRRSTKQNIDASNLFTFRVRRRFLGPRTNFLTPISPSQAFFCHYNTRYRSRCLACIKQALQFVEEGITFELQYVPSLSVLFASVFVFASGSISAPTCLRRRSRRSLSWPSFA
jgi:hypothetical protein